MEVCCLMDTVLVWDEEKVPDMSKSDDHTTM